MACPAAAGAGVLVRQYFMDGFYPTGAANPSDSRTPSGALIKAVLVNSSTDMTGIAGYPSVREGWGRSFGRFARLALAELQRPRSILSQPIDWTPLQNRVDLFTAFGKPLPSDDDVWQFESFLVS